MNIEQLQYICMTAKTNSITVAAENLYVTQQTISKAIHKLEEELGTILLIRSHKGVQLTDSGKAFVEKANHIVREFQELYDSTRVTHDRGLCGTVCLLQSSYVSHMIGSRFLTGMRRRYPDVHVMVKELLTVEMLERLRQGTTEIALVQAVNHNFGNTTLESCASWLDAEFLFRDTLVACVSETGTFAKRESVSLKELSKYPVAWGGCMHINEIMQQEYQIDLQVLIDSVSVSMQREAVLTGTAFSFATEWIVHSEQYNTDGIKILPLKENMRLETYLIKPKGYVLTPLQCVVVEELKNTLQKI